MWIRIIVEFGSLHVRYYGVKLSVPALKRSLLALCACRLLKRK